MRPSRRRPSSPATTPRCAGPERRANEARIDRLLASLDNATLAHESRGVAGGRSAVQLRRARAAQSRVGAAATVRSRRLGRSTQAANRPPADSDGYRPPVKLGVLLPLSGELSKAAVPVRDGLLAGYYGEGRRRPDIVFYDTAGSPGGAVATYARARRRRCRLHRRPLGRDEVSALFHERLIGSRARAQSRYRRATGRQHQLLADAGGRRHRRRRIPLARNARHVLVLADNSLQRAVAHSASRLESRGGDHHRNAGGRREARRHGRCVEGGVQKGGWRRCGFPRGQTRTGEGARAAAGGGGPRPASRASARRNWR